MNTNVTIRLLEEQDIPVISSAFEKVGWSPRLLILETYFFEQNKGTRVIFIAFVNYEFAGYVTVKWKSDYPPFADKGIPEIVDLNVLPKFQRRRIASALMDKSEETIYQSSPIAGIGVGLFSDYGPAQQMYVKRGYVPNGLGIAYKGVHVKPGQTLPIDDDLILYFIKVREKSN